MIPDEQLPRPPKLGEKPPDNLPFMLSNSTKTPLPPKPIPAWGWLLVLVLFFASLFILLRLVAELRQITPLAVVPAFQITPILPIAGTATPTLMPTPTLADTATASPTITPSPTPTNTPSPTATPTLPPPPATASPLPTLPPPSATVPFLVQPVEPIEPNWNNNFQNDPRPLLPPLRENWQAYAVGGLAGANWFLAVTAFLMWHRQNQPTSPPPLLINVPASAPKRVVGRNDARLPIQRIVAVAAPPPPHSPLPTGDGGSTGDSTSDGTGEQPIVTSDDSIVTGDTPLTGDGSLVTDALNLPIVPPRRLVGEERLYAQTLWKNGMSKNQLCATFFGSKNAGRMALINEVLNEH